MLLASGRQKMVTLECGGWETGEDERKQGREIEKKKRKEVQNDWQG
jgi:hypothetical protein